MILRYLPNVLTLTRLFLIVPFLMFLSQKENVYAFYTFVLAGFTDGLDGWLARHFGWQSLFGSFIDPLADKLLIAASFISLAVLGKLPWWLVVLVFLRDVTISIGVLVWYWLVHHHLDFEPTRLSKVNTLLQLALVTICLFELAFFSFSPYLVDSLILITAVTTAVTFLDYVWTWSRKAVSKSSQLPQ